MNIIEQLHQEIDRFTEPLAYEVLDFLHFIRMRHSHAATETPRAG